MLKVLSPSKNRQIQGYSNRHKCYDHSGKGNLNYSSSLYGKIVQSKNSETRNWIKKSGEKLTTNDYGNYCKIKGEIDGKTIYQLGAHFKQGTVLPVGTEVKRGQVVAQIGFTGNCTAPHSHTEYRDADNKNFAVQLVNEVKEEKDMQSKEQIIIDVYKAETGEYPSDDEKKQRLQENLNTVELIERIHGDSRFFEKWVKPHIPEKDTSIYAELEAYKEQALKLNEALIRVGITQGSDFPTSIGKVSWLVDQYLDTEERLKQAKDDAKKLMVDALGLWERFKMLFM